MEKISKWIPVEDFDAGNTGCMTARDYPTIDEPIVDEPIVDEPIVDDDTGDSSYFNAVSGALFTLILMH